MHELSIMSNILDIVIEHAEANNAKKVHKINLKIGLLSDIIPEWAQSYFDMLTKDTIADESELIIEKVPIKIKCHSCENIFTLEDKTMNFFCNKCKSTDIEILSGRELQITSIEID